MYVNLLIGTLLVSTTVLTHTFGLIALSRAMDGIVRWFRLHRHDFGKTVAMVMTVLGLFFVHSIEVWTWAAWFVALGVIPQFENALYFSTVTFSTVGYGDIVPDPAWRLFASLEGVNGFILIGWSTAYLVAASTRYGPFRPGQHF